MGTLSSEQVIFALTSVGKLWMYEMGSGLPGETFIQSFLNEIQNPVGQLATRLALAYGLRYENGEIILDQPPSIVQIQLELQKIGARVPPDYRQTPAEAMRYLQEYGHLYLQFGKPTSDLTKLRWIDDVPNTLFLNMPMVSGADAYLNLYLETHLRDLYTDFDLFNIFPKQKSVMASLSNRDEIIAYLVDYHRPGGYLWVSFAFSQIQLVHEWGQLKASYKGSNAIIAAMYEGTMYLEGQPVPHVVLYQLAFLMCPLYIYRIYGTDADDIALNQFQSVYHAALQHIRIAEQRGEQKLRFSDRLRELNTDLNR